jgi:hypothetical protein
LRFVTVWEALEHHGPSAPLLPLSWYPHHTREMK